MSGLILTLETKPVRLLVTGKQNPGPMQSGEKSQPESSPSRGVDECPIDQCGFG